MVARVQAREVQVMQIVMGRRRMLLMKVEKKGLRFSFFVCFNFKVNFLFFIWFSHNNQSFCDTTEEQRRLAEGADALLNLAGIATSNNYHCDSIIRSPAVKRLGSPEFNSVPPHPYYSAANQTNITHNYSSPPKKHKSRMLKSKQKKKASWLR